jgi:RHS repeat-associated protein
MDETDNPSWVTGTGTAVGQTDVYSPSLSSGLSVTRKTNGTTTTNYMNVGNLHGDTIISLQLPTTGYVTGPSELNVYDEYGVPQSPELDNRPIGLGVDKRIDTTQLFALTYGSLGQPQRETTDTGIQFMGARGYNPITGQFLSPDPVQGGNETPYNYPNDPINKSDISGTIGFVAGFALDLLTSAGAKYLALALTAAVCAASVFCALGVALGTTLLAGALSGALSGALDGKSAAGIQASAIRGMSESFLSFGAGKTGKAAARGMGLALKGSIKKLTTKRLTNIERKSSQYFAATRMASDAIHDYRNHRNPMKAFIF